MIPFLTFLVLEVNLQLFEEISKAGPLGTKKPRAEGRTAESTSTAYSWDESMEVDLSLARGLRRCNKRISVEGMELRPMYCHNQDIRFSVYIV